MEQAFQEGGIAENHQDSTAAASQVEMCEEDGSGTAEERSRLDVEDDEKRKLSQLFHVRNKILSAGYSKQ